jgi:flagellar biosynthesis protein FlhF
MRIKKYVADSMPEALKLVKADLGARAVILNTRTVKKGSKLGILGKGQVEVTAAADATKGKTRKKPAPRKASGPASQSSVPTGVGQSPRLPPAPGPSRTPAKTESATQPDLDWADRISQQIKRLQASVQTGGRVSPVLPGALGSLSDQFLEAGLGTALAEELLNNILLEPGDSGLKDLKPLQNLAAKQLSGKFRNTSPTRLGKGVRTVVALVGPSGAGKTTAAARMVAHFKEQQGAKALLVAADTDRVGGLEQLRAFAAILDTPVVAVRTPGEMEEVVRSHRNVDLILLDTAGISPIAAEQVDQLATLLQGAGPSEVHLVLSASNGLQHMRDALEAYARVGVDHLFLTKLDETARLGAACTIAIESELALSYTTDGRDVPGNFHSADPLALCDMLFHRRANAG